MWINNNQLKTLDVSRLTKMKRLVAFSNALERVNVKGLSTLEYLDLSQNRLEEFPEFTDLKALIHINLFGNKLSRLNFSQHYFFKTSNYKLIPFF